MKKIQYKYGGKKIVDGDYNLVDRDTEIHKNDLAEVLYLKITDKWKDSENFIILLFREFAVFSRDSTGNIYSGFSDIMNDNNNLIALVIALNLPFKTNISTNVITFEDALHSLLENAPQHYNTFIKILEEDVITKEEFYYGE